MKTSTMRGHCYSMHSLSMCLLQYLKLKGSELNSNSQSFFPLPFFLLCSCQTFLASHFCTNWLSQLGLGNQVASTYWSSLTITYPAHQKIAVTHFHKCQVRYTFLKLELVQVMEFLENIIRSYFAHLTWLKFQNSNFSFEFSHLWHKVGVLNFQIYNPAKLLPVRILLLKAC